MSTIWVCQTGVQFALKTRRFVGIPPSWKLLSYAPRDLGNVSHGVSVCCIISGRWRSSGHGLFLQFWCLPKIITNFRQRQIRQYATACNENRWYVVESSHDRLKGCGYIWNGPVVHLRTLGLYNIRRLALILRIAYEKRNRTIFLSFWNR